MAGADAKTGVPGPVSRDDEDEIPEWEAEEEEIPERLEKKWQKDEQKGIKAGVCRVCGWPFTQDELSCAHCGARTDMGEGVLAAFHRWLFKTPLGILTLTVIFASVAAFLLRH